MMDKLKRCPFCGSYNVGGFYKGSICFISCRTCDASGPSTGIEGDHYVEIMAKKWNTRYDPRLNQFDVDDHYKESSE